MWLRYVELCRSPGDVLIFRDFQEIPQYLDVHDIPFRMNGWSFIFLDMQRREDIVDHSIAIALQCLSRAAAYM